MSSKKPSLGRGLGALLGQPVAASVPGAPARALDEELTKLPVDLLQRGKYQPRLDMRQESLQELADSIKSQGVIQPIVVRPVGAETPGQPQRYEIIAGERRWRATQLAGIHEIPVVIRRVNDEAAVAMALIENIQRENLNPLEEARALDRLIKEFDMTHQTAADAVGRSRAAVSNLLRLMDLADPVKQRLENREIEMGHARALLSLDSAKKQIDAANTIVQKSLSVRETEALVRRMQAEPQQAAQEAAGRDPNIKKLETDLSDKLGAKVQLQQNGPAKGKLIISYNSLDELDGILDHIK
jgi:ParB family transcriptional regulator, chromosome partitioning protein